MSLSSKNKNRRPSKSVILVAVAWAFIGGQGLLAAGSLCNYSPGSGDGETVEVSVPWGLVSEGANRVRLVAAQAQPDVIGSIAVFLAVANALGLVALTLGLLSWSRSQHTSGKVTMAVAVTVILVNSILNLPYA
jgi:hypothetical protein